MTALLAIPPGETIREILENRNIAPTEFAALMGLSDKETENLLTGRKPISFTTSELLEKTLGIPASFWVILEAVYRKNLEKEKNSVQPTL